MRRILNIVACALAVLCLAAPALAAGLPSGLALRVQASAGRLRYDLASPKPYALNGDVLTFAGNDWAVQNASQPWSVLKSPNYPAYRFEVHQGDLWPGDGTSAKDRSELAVTGVKETFGQDYWLAWAFRYSSPTWTSTATSLRANVGQLHPACACLAAWDLEIQPAGQLKFTYARDTTSDHSATVQTDLWTSAASVKDLWTYVVLHWKANADTTHGVLELWVNGAKVVDQPDIAWGYVNDVGSYLKFGIYRNTRVDTVVAEYLNVEHGTSSLAARIAAPLAVPDGTPSAANDNAAWRALAEAVIPRKAA